MSANAPRPVVARVAAGFTLVETLVAVAIIGITFLALYTGFMAGWALVQVARENLRATQILAEKMETIRLYNWDQVNSNGFIPATFTAAFYATNGVTNGILYSGTVAVANAPLTESYSNDLRLVTVNLSWTSSGILRQRQMSTFISRYGLQNYVY